MISAFLLLEERDEGGLLSSSVISSFTGIFLAMMAVSIAGNLRFQNSGESALQGLF